MHLSCLHMALLAPFTTKSVALAPFIRTRTRHRTHTQEERIVLQHVCFAQCRSLCRELHYVQLHCAKLCLPSSSSQTQFLHKRTQQHHGREILVTMRNLIINFFQRLIRRARNGREHAASALREAERTNEKEEARCCGCTPLRALRNAAAPYGCVYMGDLGRERAGLSASDRFQTGFGPVSPCHVVTSDAQSMSPCHVRCTVIMSDAQKCHAGCTVHVTV